jgi:PST family polysaccharide transporter
MTSVHSVLAALGIILVDLAGRAGLDKMLAMAGDPTMVAQWAQLQSVVELVSAVSLAGVLQGLTVLVAQLDRPREESSLLGAALKLGIVTSSGVAVVFLVVIGYFEGEIKPALIIPAAISGCIAVVPATLNAYWLGKHQQQRMFGLALVLSMALVLVAAGASLGLTLQGLVLTQVVGLALVATIAWRYINKLTTERPGTVALAHAGEAAYLHSLARFVPVGLAIGIMSPVSMLLVRGILAESLSWDEVGFLQALWRSTEWVTATAAGVLSLVFLPRLSATFGQPWFMREMTKAGLAVLIPAACLLLLIYSSQRQILATLYDARFSVSDTTAALFMLGSWARIASWLFLFGLFAAHRTRLIIAGEVVSLPLFAFSLWIFADGMTLERTGLLYFATYVVYLCFNATSLVYASRRPALHRSGYR